MDSGSSKHLKHTQYARKYKNTENERINFKLGEIKHRPATTELGLRNPDHHRYRRNALNDLVLRKKRQYNELNVKNQKMSKRLISQKGEISLQRLEHDYKKNREYMNRLTRMKQDDKHRTIMNDYLVYEGGRYRQPGEVYLEKTDPKGNPLRLSRTSKGNRIGTSKSRRGTSRNGSRANSKRGSRRGSRISSRKSSRRNSALRSVKASGSRLGSSRKPKRAKKSPSRSTKKLLYSKKMVDPFTKTAEGFRSSKKSLKNSKGNFRVRGFNLNKKSKAEEKMV